MVAAVAMIAAVAAAGAVGAAPTGEARTPEIALAAVPGDLSRIDSLQGMPDQQPPPQTGSPGVQDPAQQGEPPQGDPAQQAGVVPPPAVPQELLTAEERAALALVEQIIRDQEGVLMGTGFQYDPGGRPDPFQSPPPFEKLVGDISGAYSRRINIQHRLIYQILEEEHTVKVLRMWTHYE